MTVACGNSNTATGPSGSVAIVSVSPSQVTASAVPQLVEFQGSGFEAGLQLQVTDPNGANVDTPPSQIQSVTATSFQASILLAIAGTYRVAVQIPSGDVSDTVTLIVTTTATGGPTINSISPTSTLHSSLTQVVSLTGQGFSTSPTVFVTDPQGVMTQLTGGSLGGATDSSIQFSMVFNRVGLYTVSVAASSGAASNLVTVAVQ